MLAARKIGHMALNRLVWTYLPDGVPLGLITGYENAGGFVLEQIVRFPDTSPTVLVPMLRAAVAEAWMRDYAHVVLMIPQGTTNGFHLLARRFGFTVYESDDDRS